MQPRKKEEIDKLPDDVRQFKDSITASDSLVRVENIISLEALYKLVTLFAKDPYMHQKDLICFLDKRWEMLQGTRLLSSGFQLSAINQACLHIIKSIEGFLHDDEKSVYDKITKCQFNSKTLSAELQERLVYSFLRTNIFQKSYADQVARIVSEDDPGNWATFIATYVMYIRPMSNSLVDTREEFLKFFTQQVDRGRWHDALVAIHKVSNVSIFGLVLSRGILDFAKEFEKKRDRGSLTSYQDREEVEFARELLAIAKLRFEELYNNQKKIHTIIDHRRYMPEEVRAFVFFLAFIYQEIRSAGHTFESDITNLASKANSLVSAVTLGFIRTDSLYNRDDKTQAVEVFSEYIVESAKYDNLPAFLRTKEKQGCLPALADSRLGWLVKFYKQEMQRAEKMYLPEIKSTASSSVSPAAGLRS